MRPRPRMRLTASPAKADFFLAIIPLMFDGFRLFSLAFADFLLFFADFLSFFRWIFAVFADCDVSIGFPRSSACEG